MIERLTRPEGRILGRPHRRVTSTLLSVSWWPVQTTRPTSTKPPVLATRAVSTRAVSHPTERILSVGFSTPRRLGNAPQRNHLRRQLRVLVRESVCAQQLGGVVVVVGRDEVVGADFATLRSELEQLFGQLIDKSHGE